MVSTLAPRLVHGVANSHLCVETLAHWIDAFGADTVTMARITFTLIYTIVRHSEAPLWSVVAVLYIYREAVLQHRRSFAGPTSRDGDFIIRGFKASKVWGYH